MAFHTAPNAVLIAGPTASGKTALAVAVAKALGGAVINADSMQVYRDLFVLSARPDKTEQAGVEHALFGHIDGAVNYSAGKWRADAADAIQRMRDAGQTPVIAGGTGLYFRTLVEGLSDIPPVPTAVRQNVRAMADVTPLADLHRRLTEVDPVLGVRIRPGDHQRIVRALEVYEATGQPLSSFQNNRGPALLEVASCVCVFLAPERALLRERINRRFEKMVENGAIDEVERLAARSLDPQLPVMRAHGVPGLLAFLRGEMSFAQAIEKGKGDTRRYAKRQFTWFRHQLPGFEWTAPEAALEAVLEQIGLAQNR